MKKNILNTAIVFVLTILNQNSLLSQIITANEYQTANSFNAEWEKNVTVLTAQKDIFYLFKNWNNTSVIQDSNSKGYIIKNMNYDILKDNFTSKVSNDSVYVFDKNSIKEVKINNKVFSIYNNNYYEVLSDNNEFSFLKQYKMQFKRGYEDPITREKKTDTYKVINNYFILKKDSNSLNKVKLRKKDFFPLLTKNEKSKIIAFKKKKNLSFKKEDDIKQIMTYLKTLK